MDVARVCPQCQQPVPPDAPQGACPTCLLQLAVAAERTDETLADVRPGAADPPSIGFIPRSFAGYDLLAELGRGGMGVVYRAQQRTPHRLVALKVLLSGEHAGAEELARFRTESEAVAALNHPNVVRVYEVGEHDGRPYFSMELIGGGSLAERLRRGPLPPSEAAALTEVLARAVHAAHQAGVVHRDLTPGNVLLAADGTAKVTDFGLAKRLDPASPGRESGENRTASGAVLGTPGYMAPEQASGESRTAGPAADIYALGAILYEMLTGRPPFQAATAVDTILRVLSDEPVPPRQLQPRLPRDLETVCLKCLRKEPEKRHASAAALADDLRRYQEGRPVTARPVGQLERTWRWCRRNPAIAAMMASVVLLLTVIAVGGIALSLSLKVALNDAREKKADAEAAGELANTERRKARLREADALVGQAHGIRSSHRPGQRFEALEVLQQAADIGRELGQPPEWFDRLRNEAIGALAVPDIHMTQTWHGCPPGTHQADVSYDFELYGRTTKQGACSVRRIADDTEVLHIPELGEAAAVSFGPERLLMIIGESSHHYQVWDLRGPDPILRVDRKGGSGWGSLSPFHRSFVWNYDDGSLDVFAADTGECKHHLAPAGFTADTSCLHPTEPLVVHKSGGSPTVQVRDLRTGAVVTGITLPWRGTADAAWSPDGRTLAVSDFDTGQVHLYALNLAARELRLTRVLRIPGCDGGTGLKFNPAGDRMVTQGWGGGEPLFHVATGRLLFSTHGLSHLGQLLRFDAVGQRLAAHVSDQEGRIGLWSVADGREYQILVHDGPGRKWHGSGMPAVHPRGRLAVLGLRDGLSLFDLETGGELAFVPVALGIANACFDGDGNLFTNSLAGVFRWPVRLDLAHAERITIGPPQRLPFPIGNRTIATSRDGRVIAQAIFKTGVWVQYPGTEQARQITSDMWDHMSVSPDGRWLAASGQSGRLNVYEIITGKLAWQCPNCLARFSPDGRWLLTENDGGRAYLVGTWEPGPQLGSGAPWTTSPDGRLVVLEVSGGYRLVEFASGRELARLEPPDLAGGIIAFTPDGTRLVSAAEDGLRVWDLRRIRAELLKLGLDWDALPYPDPGPADHTPLEVTFAGP